MTSTSRTAGPDGHTPAGPAPTRVRRRRPRAATLALGGLALAALLSAGCSSDDDADASSDPTTTAAHDAGHDDGHDDGADDGADAPEGPAPLVGTEMSEESCGHFATLSASMVAGDPTVAGPALEMFVPSLPPELSAQGTTVVDGLSAAFEGDQEAMFAPEFLEAHQAVGDAMWAGCVAQSRPDVTGVDYGFEGLPEQVPAGMMALRFTNGTSSSEPHELIILQRPPGDTTPIDDIAAMSPEKIMEDFPMIGVVFVDTPEASSTSFIDLPTGSYIAICTIPVGGGETGDPHASHGMIAELEAV
ncbi:MAG: hypothetical protein M3Y51_06755 [Actinomycetota bacterium]|nr:hypothetical protein [Actinomycetota bacterium]